MFCTSFGRCVHDNQRSFALGIQWIKVRILGTIPAPMIFGTLIDNTCILWQESCDDAGNCLVYDNHYMSKYVPLLLILSSISHQSIKGDEVDYVVLYPYDSRIQYLTTVGSSRIPYCIQIK